MERKKRYKRINYNRVCYVSMDSISDIVFKKLYEQEGITKMDIVDVAYYRYGVYSKQPLLVFLRDGRIFKVGIRKGNIVVVRIK